MKYFLKDNDQEISYHHTFWLKKIQINDRVQSDGVAEYTESISADGLEFLQRVPLIWL